ncbi:MAG: hypothetical protein ACYTE5_05185 [Planctomycetota bacterium]|jgi:hypothetical protein
MKKLVEDTCHITAKQVAEALPEDTEAGMVELEIAGSHVQQISIVSTVSNLQGFVRWFICPACKNRVGRLYLPAGEIVFLCRKCHGLAYRAQVNRAFKKPEKRKDRTKRKYTEKDWRREAVDFLKEIRQKRKGRERGEQQEKPKSQKHEL